MTRWLDILSAGPGLTLQDLGRPFHMASGLSTGGAADRLALFEAAALLGLKKVVCGIEMAGMGGRFQFTEPTRFALTGAPMRTTLDGRALRWNASHMAEAGQMLEIGGAQAGVYGYLTPAGGFDGAEILGSRAAHLAVGIGAPMQSGDRLEILPDLAPDTPARVLPDDPRFSGGTLRLVRGPQTDLFAPETLTRFLGVSFIRSPVGNRQGMRLEQDGAPFGAEVKGQASDLILPGDVQMTGEGIPYVLLAECQTTGGYARIGSVIADDLPRAAQTPPGACLRFEMLTTEAADKLWRPETGLLKALSARTRPLLRNPRDIPDLLSYQLIGGVTAGDEED